MQGGSAEHPTGRQTNRRTLSSAGLRAPRVVFADPLLERTLRWEDRHGTSLAGTTDSASGRRHGGSAPAALRTERGTMPHCARNARSCRSARGTRDHGDGGSSTGSVPVDVSSVIDIEHEDDVGGVGRRCDTGRGTHLGEHAIGRRAVHAVVRPPDAGCPRADRTRTRRRPRQPLRADARRAGVPRSGSR